MCDGCTAALRRIEAPLCERCGAPTAWPVQRCAECAGRRLAFARARAALAYDDRLRPVVAAWKERGLRRLAAWAAAVVRESLPRPDAACVVFVPVRTFLTRARGSPRQRGLAQHERRRNVADAFLAHGRVPSRVVLVDDVYTTGATANAAASALRKGGARTVEVVTFARTIRIR